VLHLPIQFAKILYFYAVYQPDRVVVLDAMVLLNCLLPLSLLDLLAAVNIHLYVGDAPSLTKPNQLVGQMVEALGIPMIANSKFVKHRFNQLGVSSTSIQVVHNGVEWEQWAEVESYNLRERCNWSSETLLVGYAGQLIERKGIDDFIKAAGQVLDRNPAVRFVVMGRFDEADPYHRQLRASADKKGGDRIVFTGYMDEIERAYAALDVHVVPSRMEEPCGNVNLEAMAAGVPVISTDRGGNPELIVQGETGYLVEGESPSALATRILQLTDDESLRDQMGKNARQHVRENFRLSKTVSDVEQILLHA
jgi:glycosyltransferase involved in cell wall biosynthesis